MGVYAMEGELDTQRPLFFTPSTILLLTVYWLLALLFRPFRSLIPPSNLPSSPFFQREIYYRERLRAYVCYTGRFVVGRGRECSDGCGLHSFFGFDE